MTPYLIVPGWAGSGPDHWQSHWERELAGARRVEMPDWLAPRRGEWVRSIDDAVRASEAPPILIAHSLGCLAVAHWAANGHPVRGALLVAPPDLDRADCPALLGEFAPVPRARLAFPCHVVASDNDPYATLSRACQMAADWGARVTLIRGAGHLNAESGFGRWRDGRALLDALEAVARDAATRGSERTVAEGPEPITSWLGRARGT